MFDDGTTQRDGRRTSRKSQDGFMRLNVDIVTSGGMQDMSKKRNVTEVCCRSQSKTCHETSIGNHDWSRHLSTVPEIRLAELVLDTVVSGAHAVFEMFRNTNTLLLEACQRRRSKGTESLETGRHHHCRIKL